MAFGIEPCWLLTGTQMGSKTSDNAHPGQWIDGVTIKQLVWHNDQRGSLTEMVRSDDAQMMVAPIGQVYMTTLYPGVVKAWHLHEKQWDRMVVVHGNVLLGLVDGRSTSSTVNVQMRVLMGERNHVCVLIPPGVHHGLKNIGTEEAKVVNVVSEVYDRDNPDEKRVEPHGTLPFSWDRVDS